MNNQADGKRSSSRNAFVLVLDSLRYDVVSNPVACRYLAPNLEELVRKSAMCRVVTNAQSTQFVMPALFSCTYPLDFGGYNDGIRDRPKSFVEVFKDAGYETCLMATANQLGLGHGYQRGFDVIGTTSDYRTQVEFRILRTMNHDLNRYRRGETSEAEAIERVRVLMEPLLDGLIDAIKHHDRSIWPKGLELLNARIAESCVAEKRLLAARPEVVLAKLMRIAPGLYWRYLGKENPSGPKFLLHRALTGLSWRSRTWISRQTLVPILFLQHYQVIAGDVARAMVDVITKRHDKPWLVHVHLMDLHDCRAANRFAHMLGLLRYLPRWLSARRRGLTKRRFLYDANLMYIDRVLAPFYKTLRAQIDARQTMLLITGDHGSCYAYSPRSKPYIGERMFREDLEVPLILAGADVPLQPADFTDSMGVTRTLLDVLKIAPHQSFKSFPVGSRPRDAVVSESCGHGYAEMERGDLFFTVTTPSRKGFFKVVGNALHATRLFDLAADPSELVNLVDDDAQHASVRSLAEILWRERGSLLDGRRVDRARPLQVVAARTAI